MNRITRVSLIFRVIFQLLLVGLPMLLVIGWTTSPESLVMMGGMINMSFIPHAYLNKILHELSLTDRVLGFSVSAIPMLVELYVLYSLTQLFKLYERGQIFSLANVRYIRNVGYGLLMTQIVHPIYEALMGVVLTLHNPPGHRFTAITLDQTNIGIVFIALIIILISWIMAEGCRLHEEQQFTV